MGKKKNEKDKKHVKVEVKLPQVDSQKNKPSVYARYHKTQNEQQQQ